MDNMEELETSYGLRKRGPGRPPKSGSILKEERYEEVSSALSAEEKKTVFFNTDLNQSFDVNSPIKNNSDFMNLHNLLSEKMDEDFIITPSILQAASNLKTVEEKKEESNVNSVSCSACPVLKIQTEKDNEYMQFQSIVYNELKQKYDTMEMIFMKIILKTNDERDQNVLNMKMKINELFQSVHDVSSYINSGCCSSDKFAKETFDPVINNYIYMHEKQNIFDKEQTVKFLKIYQNKLIDDIQCYIKSFL